MSDAAAGKPCPPGADPRFVIEPGASALQLRALHREAFLPLSIDWSSPELRRRIAGGRRQLLGRALGLHRHAGLRIVDACAGLGRDGLTLAALGAAVTLVERNPLLAALLDDALQRALRSPEPWLRAAAGRMNLVQADAVDWLARRPEAVDAIHLDPMYPHDDKHALPQKSMQMLRELTGGDTDADQLLDAALKAGVRRVAVKRPASAASLAGRHPDLQMRGTQARYDLYLTPSAPLAGA